MTVRGRDGSAYLLAVMVISLLSMIALSVGLLLQTEHLAANQEKVIASTHFIAESGVAVAIARATARGSLGAARFRHRGRDSASLLLLDEQADTVASWDRREKPCRYCAVNSDRAWVVRSFGLRVDAERRLAGSEGPTGVLSRRSLEARVELSPQPSSSSCANEEGIAVVRGDGKIWVQLNELSPPEERCVRIIPGTSSDVKAGHPDRLTLTDVETGSVLLEIAFDSPMVVAPAAMDVDRDGFLDAIYVGTEGGSLVRIDLRTPFPVGPARSANAAAWRSVAILSTGARRLSFPPTVFSMPPLDSVGLVLALGRTQGSTEQGGDRELLLVLVDGNQDEDHAADLSSFEELNWGQSRGSDNLLVGTPAGRRPGWLLQLGSGVRIVERPRVVGGLLLFHAVQSAVGADGTAQREICGPGERSQIFRLLVTNGDGADGESRSTDFSSCNGAPYPLQPTGFDETVAANVSPNQESGLAETRSRLMSLAPQDCRYGGYAIRWVSAVGVAGGGLFPLAEVPICVVLRDWRVR